MKLKLPLVRKLSKVWLKFIIAIVQSKTEIVQTMRTVQSFIGETVSEKTRFVGFKISKLPPKDR